MKIAIIGTGYVGLVSGVCFSEFGFSVTCVDNNEKKINELISGKVPIYEPGLEELLKRNVEANRLNFSTNLPDIVKKSDVIFISVGTPSRRGDGHADLTYVYSAAKEISSSMLGYTVIVTKSTVPVGTGREVKKIIQSNNPKANFDIISNPEFLREGSAVNDFMRPDRIVVGYETKKSKEIMSSLYKPLYLLETPILFTSLETSELIKYASNSFLAMKISFINQMADLSEKVGANINDVSKGIGLDNRIGSKFLHPGPGYGGSCFPKDIEALLKTSDQFSCSISLVKETIKYNNQRKILMAEKIINFLDKNIKNLTISILGLSFKPETDDFRESPAIVIIEKLIDFGALIHAYDPQAIEEAKKILPKQVKYFSSSKECTYNSDCVVILTEWNEFRALSLFDVKETMKGDKLVDLRNIFSKKAANDAGLEYLSIGR
ncbi:MAG: UDP-glucose 6-dehydrogenase [Rickettsiales bacterium]|nr:UDP-glucose 6-dehydrogenase [Rickettsiales bacterium]OUW05488.1 MAG: UDP-glucose 6-dehydrogenase [Betaproteobacteria bacterium TMED156]